MIDQTQDTLNITELAINSVSIAEHSSYTNIGNRIGYNYTEI